MSYAKVYKHLKPEIVNATKEMMPDIWRGDNESKEIIMRAWLVKASTIYNVPVPAFKFDAANLDGYSMTGGGCYEPAVNQITLFYKASLVTLLHEFKHMLQHVKGGYMYRDDKEQDARAWSVSLFKMANARAYRTAVRKGLLHFN